MSRFLLFLFAFAGLVTFIWVIFYYFTSHKAEVAKAKVEGWKEMKEIEAEEEIMDVKDEVYKKKRKNWN